MKHRTRKGLLAVCTAAAISLSALLAAMPMTAAAATKDVSDTMTWDAVRIGGGGFVSGIITGKESMYARTDVGGVYKFNYETDSWDQLFADLNDAERGYLSIDAMCIDPTDEDTAYFLCGCAYFSDAGTRIYKTTDGGRTFTYTDVTDLIQVHANGGGRQTGESIAVDPDNPDTIYCGGDVTAGESALIKSTDGGKTWKPVKGYDDLGMFTSEMKWPTWTSHMVRALTADEYTLQNGVSTIHIEDGKVYVGTSTTGEYNVVVADVDTDEFTALPIDTAHYPARIQSDGEGNIYFTYQGALIVGNGGAAGGIYKYDKATGKYTDISPKAGGYSGVGIDPTNPDRLITSSCGLWSAQLWQAWDDVNGPAWGDLFFKSVDGGATWTEMTPGKDAGWNQPLISEYLDDGGYAWIRDKAIHWVGAVVIDPQNPNRLHSTSGNGVFSCDNTWDDVPQFYFHPDGIEEVVVLDFTSVPGGYNYSAIGDYDGFVHIDPTEIPEQHKPNMGSTAAIAYCPQNPDVMVRIAENQNDVASGFYTLDGGKTWTEMNCSQGGKAAITELADGKYRIFQSKKSDSTTVSYSDDFGATWNTCSGIPDSYGSKPTFMFVEPEHPEIVYAYVTYFNSSWHYSKPEPTAADAQYKLCVSTDYGKTFTATDVCMYDQCDTAGRIAYLGEGELILGGGWYGLYHASVTETGSVTVEKLDSVYYCKTVGYGAPKNKGDVNALYMYGKPTEEDEEGIYRSDDGGKSWVCINSDHLYGGTGNGNFLVGDMNTYGTVYMSTVGCGIIYGQLGSGTTPPPVDDKLKLGDVNCNGTVEVADVILLNRLIAEDTSIKVTEQGMKNAEVTADDTLTSADAIKILSYLAGLDTLG